MVQGNIAQFRDLRRRAYLCARRGARHSPSHAAYRALLRRATGTRIDAALPPAALLAAGAMGVLVPALAAVLPIRQV
mgnify:CR=1 FL=1|jgi:hypothetical protein